MTLPLSRSLSPRTNIDNGSDQLLEKSPKKFRSTNTWLETKKIQNALEERKVLLEERRVEKLAQLSQGEWIPSSHLVKVTKQVGRHWTTMGHSYLGDLYLDPEEALFLLEANTIEIYFSGIPMSLQQAYSVLLGGESGCTLEEYRAFAHLTRFGYKVRRHRPEVRGKRKREEPLEIDVVGVICRRKSCDAEGPGNVVEIEDAVEVVDSVKKTTNTKDLPNPAHHFPSTSQASNAGPAADDDDIKFLEIVDTSKRRKVVSSVVIHDDIELSQASNGDKDNALSGQTANVEHDEARKKEGKSLKSEVEKTHNNSINSVSDCELELVEESNDKSRPSRGMYKNNLFASVTSSSKNPECISSIDTPSTSHNNCENEVRSGSRNEKNSAPKATETTDDVIVLSDDETKENAKEQEQAKEILKFYKEISLIELIDISEEDEEGKAANKTSDGDNSRIDENYDFWGVLGRIPILENGRMVIKIPAPPSQLIPLNIRPFREEYVVSIVTSLHGPCEGENAISRQGSKGVRAHMGEGQGGTNGERSGNSRVRAAREHPGSSSSLPQGRGQSDRPWMNSQGDNRVMGRNSYLLPPPQITQPQGNYSNQWQQSYPKNTWNPWMAWNHNIPPMNYYSNPSLPADYWRNQYQTNSSRPLWSSLVYSERQVGSFPTPNANQQWSSSSISHFHHSDQQINYQNYGQNDSAQYWAGNRLNQWQNNSSYYYGLRGGGRWQRQSGFWPRRGRSRHYGRGSGRCLLPLARRGTPQDTGAEDTFAASVVPKVPHAQNWVQLKINSEKTKPGESAIEPKPEMNKEDSKTILPLLKPADSINLSAVQSKLQITGSAKDNFYNGPENYKSSLSIKFDLYMPNSNFRKSYPGLPKYRLSIVKSEDRIPKLKDTWYLTKDLNDEVPLLFAVSFTENVNFFSFSNVELPAPLSQ